MDVKYASRFIRRTDPQTDLFVFKLPSQWWSRCFEYAWASQFVEHNSTVLDAACGISHPFKFFLADTCTDVYACDLDRRILEPSSILQDIQADFGNTEIPKLSLKCFERIQYAQADIAHLPYAGNKFDQIYCISVLEHLDPETMRLALAEFHRTLKSTGLIILTFDYPTINLEILKSMVDEVGLAFYESVDFTLPEDAIFSDLYGRLYCYRAILRKN